MKPKRPNNRKQYAMNEKLVLKRSKENIEKEWAWLFKDLPMKHRIKLVSDGDLHWLQVDFVNSHKKSVSSQKYLIHDIIMHADDYIAAVKDQCYHAVALCRKDKPVKNFKKAKEAFEDELNELMFSVINNDVLDKLCRKHFGTPEVVESINIHNETHVNFMETE